MLLEVKHCFYYVLDTLEIFPDENLNSLRVGEEEIIFGFGLLIPLPVRIKKRALTCFIMDNSFVEPHKFKCSCVLIYLI